MKIIFSVFLFLVNINLSAKIIYTDPVKDAKMVSISNSIIIGFDEKITSSDFSSRMIVKGSQSGIHAGEFLITEDNRKIIFKPYLPFEFNEIVEVKLFNLKTAGKINNSLSYSFQTQINKPEYDYSKYSDEESNNLPFKNYVYNENDHLLPSLAVNLTNNPTPGRIYLNSFKNPIDSAHIYIVNNDASIYYSRQTAGNITDFKKQPNGTLTYYSYLRQKHFSEDVNYNKLDSFYCGNGYSTDTHDLKVLSNGHALLLSYDPQIVNMSLIVPGGNPNCTVIGLIIQEIDVNKNVVFQWRSWDHFNIVDATHTNLTLTTVDYVHGNSVELDTDGNLIISSRHLSEITKINRSTGAIIWRLGGVNNQFAFPNDSISISFQHDARRIANGNLTIYDNGYYHSTYFSRAIEYKLDEVNKIATLVWEYRNNPDIFGVSRGSTQRLHNGNTLIGWGSTYPTLSEVTPSGEIVLEMTFQPLSGTNLYTYRAFKDELSITLNLKLAIEGFYNSTSNKMKIRDTVTAYLRNINSPYNIVDTSKTVVDTLSLSGIFKFYNAPTGNYYVSIKHRNSLETWSKTGGESLISGAFQNYDISDLSSKAYGNNLVQVDTSPIRFALYSGDLNYDSFVDLTDVVFCNNDAGNFVTGYKLSDFNGDYISDLNDVLIAYNNSSNFVGSIVP